MDVDEEDTEAVNSFAETADQLSLNELSNFLRSDCLREGCRDQYVAEEEMDNALDDQLEADKKRVVKKTASLHTCQQSETINEKTIEQQRTHRFRKIHQKKWEKEGTGETVVHRSANNNRSDDQPQGLEAAIVVDEEDVTVSQSSIQSDDGYRLGSHSWKGSELIDDNQLNSTTESSNKSLDLQRIKLLMKPSNSSTSENVDPSLLEPHLNTAVGSADDEDEPTDSRRVDRDTTTRNSHLTAPK